MQVLWNLFIPIFFLKYGCPTSVTFPGFTKDMSSFGEADTHKTTTAAELTKRLSTIPYSTKTTYGKISEVVQGSTTNSITTNQGSATTYDFSKTTYRNTTESPSGPPTFSGATSTAYQGPTTASEPTNVFTPDSGTMKTTNQEPILTSDSTETIAGNGPDLDEISTSDCSQSIQKMRTAFICVAVGAVIVITAVVIITRPCQRRGSYTFK